MLRRVAAGRTNREIAAELVLNVPTVERDVANIYAKIGANRRVEAAQFAMRHGLGPEAARAHDPTLQRCAQERVGKTENPRASSGDRIDGSKQPAALGDARLQRQAKAAH